MNIAMIGGGMVGQCYAQAFAAAGLKVCGIWDTKHGEALRRVAEQLGTTLYSDAGPWLADADVVISAVFGSAALTVAGAALPAMRRGAFYVDMTTADPDDMARADQLATASGQHFVDVAITGAVNLQMAATPLLCAGTEAARVVEIYRRIGAPIQAVGERPGDAASLKLLRSVFTKGLEALTIECLATAEKRGLTEQLHVVLSDIDQMPLRTLMESLVQTHIPHAGRRSVEVQEASRQVSMAGLQPLVTTAVGQFFERTVQREKAHPFTGKGTQAALAWLVESAAARGL